MREQPEMLRRLNTAIGRIADEAESENIGELRMVQFDDIAAGEVFGGIVDLHCTFAACGGELRHLDNYQLVQMMRVRLQDSFFQIIDLAKEELIKLGVAEDNL